MNDELKSSGFIPRHGGYRNLITFRKSEVIYDGTIYFTNRFFGRYDRTASQMVQAARSGKQNIAEGSVISATSKETEIKLTNVARASLEELLIDYTDFLRSRKLEIWDKEHRLVRRLRQLNRGNPNPNYETFRKAIEHENPEICANTMITLINITTYLLNKQLQAMENNFINNGGLRERMQYARFISKSKKE